MSSPALSMDAPFRAPGKLASFRIPALMLVPALLVSAFFFVVPMAALFVNSFTVMEGGQSHASLANYINVIGDSYYWEILLRTVILGLTTTAVTLVVGYPAALYLYFSESKWRRVFLFMIVSPLFISVIVRTYGWIVIMGPSGAINSLLPPNMQLRLLRTDTAIVIGLTHIYLPFMVLSLNAALFKMDKKLLAAARSLGAPNWRIFWDVMIPMSLPGIIAGCVIVFSMSMTAFGTPVLLGGAVRKTMAYLVYQQNIMLGNWQAGSALAFFLLFITLSIVAVVSRLGARASQRAAA